MRSIYWTMPMVVEDDDEKSMIPEKEKKSPERALVPGT